MPFDSSPALKVEMFTGDLSVVTPITSDLCLWIEDAQQALQELKKMPRNWDSYGSPKITSQASTKVANLLPLLARCGMPKPKLFPISGGGLQLEWQRNERELEIEIHPNGGIEYLKVYSEEEMEEGKATEESVFELAQWYKSDERLKEKEFSSII